MVNKAILELLNNLIAEGTKFPDAIDIVIKKTNCKKTDLISAYNSDLMS
jgi:hypothetical protein